MSEEAAAKRRKTDDDTMAPGEGADGGGTASVSSDVMSNMKQQIMLQMKNEMNQQLLAMKADINQQMDLRILKMENDMKMEKDNAALLKNDLEQQIVQLKRDINEQKLSENDMKLMKNELDQQINELKSDLIQHKLEAIQQREYSNEHIFELENQVHRLTDKCRSLERTVKLLTTPKNEKWEYKVPVIPSRHWIDVGISDEETDEDYCERVKPLLDTMKEKTCGLRGGIYIRGICLGNKDGMMIFHDDILLPHWNQLADALQLSTYSDAPITIDISNVELVKGVLLLIEPALSTKSFKHFCLDSNEFQDGHTGIKFAINVIQNNWKLESFKWVNNPVNCRGYGIKLANTILNHPSLCTIVIHHFFTGTTEDELNGHIMLCRLLSASRWTETAAKRLGPFPNGDKEIELVFTNNNVRTMGSTHIPDFIDENSPLAYLNLSGNHLNDNDARFIADALRVNTKLKSINLGANNITSVGFNALKIAIFNTSSLNAVADSNHTCTIKGVGVEPSWINNKSNEKQVNRDRKLFTLLSTRSHEGSNVSLLDKELGEDSLKFAPKVLGFLNTYHHQMFTRRLAITFDILRNWRMPELYEYQRASRKPTSIVLVRNIPTECSDSTLTKLFSQHKGYKKLTTIGEGYASIEFGTKEEATAALQQLNGFKESTWSSALNLTYD